MSYAETSPAALERHECECAAQDALTAAAAKACSEIRRAFTVGLRRAASLKGLQLVCTTRYPGQALRETTHCAEDTVQQLLLCDHTWPALERVIREGTGPLCDALRQALADDHCAAYAEELAIVRTQGGEA